MVQFHEYYLLIIFFLPRLAVCRVFPSHYSFRDDDVIRSENDTNACINYDENGECEYVMYTCRDIRFSDSDYGPQQYSDSDQDRFYIWKRGDNSRLLFTFPSTVQLTYITLHYYSDSYASLPTIGLRQVDSEWKIWRNVPSTGALEPGIDSTLPMKPGSLKTVTHNVTGFSSSQLLMVITAFSRQNQSFFLSEVEFFNQMTVPEPPTQNPTYKSSGTSANGAATCTQEKTTTHRQVSVNTALATTSTTTEDNNVSDITISSTSEQEIVSDNYNSTIGLSTTVGATTTLKDNTSTSIEQSSVFSIITTASTEDKNNHLILALITAIVLLVLLALVLGIVGITAFSIISCRRKKIGKNEGKKFNNKPKAHQQTLYLVDTTDRTNSDPLYSEIEPSESCKKSMITPHCSQPGTQEKADSIRGIICDKSDIDDVDPVVHEYNEQKNPYYFELDEVHIAAQDYNTDTSPESVHTVENMHYDKKPVMIKSGTSQDNNAHLLISSSMVDEVNGEEQTAKRTSSYDDLVTSQKGAPFSVEAVYSAVKKKVNNHTSSDEDVPPSIPPHTVEEMYAAVVKPKPEKITDDHTSALADHEVEEEEAPAIPPHTTDEMYAAIVKKPKKTTHHDHTSVDHEDKDAPSIPPHTAEAMYAAVVKKPKKKRDEETKAKNTDVPAVVETSFIEASSSDAKETDVLPTTYPLHTEEDIPSNGPDVDTLSGGEDPPYSVEQSYMHSVV